MGLHRLRSDAQLTQKDLAERSTIPAPRLSQWESETRDPKTMRLDTAARLAESLEITLDELWEELI